MDLSNINLKRDAEVPFEFELLHPVSREKMDIFVQVVGEHSDQFRKYLQQSVRQYQKDQRQAAKTGKEKERTLAEADDERAESAAARTVGWSKMIENGVEIPYSYETSLDLFRRHLWMTDQIIAESKDAGNFTKG